MEKILVVTIKQWNLDYYYKIKKKYSNNYDFFLISNKKDFNHENVKKINPKYIFFPHWSWIIPKDIFNNFQCIVFHMTDLPFGRGGSPLQNLISRKIYKTKVSAIKVDEGIDTGDIFLKKDINISKGSAEDILKRVSKIIFEKMIPEILLKNISPKKQTGEVTSFKRRKKSESNILNNINHLNSLEDFYDFIRMLDGEGYPKAFIEIGNFKINFTKAKIKNDKLLGEISINEKIK